MIPSVLACTTQFAPATPLASQSLCESFAKAGSMDWLSNRFQEILALVGPNPYLKALAVILLATVAAKLADWILTVLIGRWARRTRTELDDRVIRHLHGPIFTSVLLFGLVAATELLALPETVTGFTMA